MRIARLIASGGVVTRFGCTADGLKELRLRHRALKTAAALSDYYASEIVFVGISAGILHRE